MTNDRIEWILRKADFFFRRMWQETSKISRVAQAPREHISEAERHRRMESFQREREKYITLFRLAILKLDDELEKMETFELN